MARRPVRPPPTAVSPAVTISPRRRPSASTTWPSTRKPACVSRTWSRATGSIASCATSRRHRIGHLVFEARLWSGAPRLARARPLQGLRLVLGRRLQPRPLRPPQAGLTSRSRPMARARLIPGRPFILIFSNLLLDQPTQPPQQTKCRTKRPSSSPNRSIPAEKSCVYGRTLG